MHSALFKSLRQSLAGVFLSTVFVTGCATTETLPPEVVLTAVDKAALGDLDSQEFYTTQTASSVNVYRAGDFANVEIYNEPALSGKYIVDAAGNSAFPYIGTVQVAGLTAQQLQERLSELYGREYFQNVNILVTMDARDLGHIVVDGSVVRPGVIELSETIRLTEAIARAGGIAKEGNSENVFVVRETGEKRTPYRVDLNAVRLAQAPDPILLPSDIVYVQEEGYQFDYDEILRVIPLLNFLVITGNRI